jgi:hypothetical protein
MLPVSPSATAPRPRSRRPLLLAWTGVTLAALGLIVPAVAAAAPAPSVQVIGTTLSPYGALQVDGVSGFAPNDALTFALDGTDVTNQLVVTTTEADGSITQQLGNLHFPGASGGSVGSHTLTVTDTGGDTASVALTVIPSPVPTPARLTRTVSQMRSTGVTVRFDGFLPGDTVTVGMASQVNGSPCGSPRTADASGSVTTTCVWDAAYVARFGQTPAADSYVVGANNSIFTIYSDSAAVTVVADAVVTPPATPRTSGPTAPRATTPVAGPAVPVRDHARFTG